MKTENTAANENRKTPKKSEEFRNDSQYGQVESADVSDDIGAAKALADSMVETMETLLAAVEAKDKRNTKRIIRPNHRSVTGWLANDVTGDAVPFESTLERDCAYIALFEKRVTEVQAQPITIPYKMENGKQSHYTPDYQVTYRDGGARRKAILEVKELATLQENKAKLQCKYIAAEQWCVDNDKTFHVVSERQLRPALIENTRFLYRQRLQWNFDTLASGKLLSDIRSQLPLTIKEILDKAASNKTQRAKTQTLLWGLIASRLVYVDLLEDITPQTIVHDRSGSASPPMFFTPGEPWRT